MVKLVDDELFAALCDLTREAGQIALGFFNPGEKTTAEISWKAGNSPVTVADNAANDFLKQHLCALVSDAAWLSEETTDTAARLGHQKVLIVDPIDGTRAFMTGDARWAVSVALVVDGLPDMAVLYAPALGQTFTAVRGHGAWLNNQQIRVKKPAKFSGGQVAGPKPFADILHQRGYLFDLVPKIPSLALRFATVAAGQIDMAFASADAHEWDIAAADLILHEAGGRIVDGRGIALRYNQPRLNHAMLFALPESLVGEVLQAASPTNASNPVILDTPAR